ncbi:MAG: hypothetical protein IJW20_07060 [Clostridia bacterium]|nr:hypothetical protein [Clostridia bacterium]
MLKSNVYNEILEILKYIPSYDFEKIPETVLEDFRKKKEECYDFSFDLDKPLEQQEISRDTYILFVSIYKNYIANEYEKNKINEMLRLNELAKSKKSEIKYSQNVFKKREKINKKITNEVLEEKMIIVYKKDFWNKIIEKIKRLFVRKK